MSKEIISVSTLIISFFMLMLFSNRIVLYAGEFMIHCIDLIKTPLGHVTEEIDDLRSLGIHVLVGTVIPMILATVACAVVATFAQTRLLVATELLKPKFSRINPIEGFKKLFSLKNVIEALKGIMKITILLVLIYSSLRDMFLESSKYLYVEIPASVQHIFSVGKGMVYRIILAFVVVAAADYLYQWWQFEKDMRMSKQEIKEEYKQTEGDPQIKGKIRDIQRQRARMRMMQQIPQADVVIRNPTHYAVALRYDTERDNAPVVLAKGQDELAMRIVRKAEEHNITVVENVPLARALYAQVELDQEIPPELYGAVAEVLVYIFKIDSDLKLVK